MFEKRYHVISLLDFGGSCSGLAEDSVLLVHEAVSLGKRIPTF
jgi:hypothetical protein